MAEIEIERRPRRSGWTWFALLLVLAAVAVGAWLVFGNGVEGGQAVPAAERTIEEPREQPLAPVEAPEPVAPGETEPQEGAAVPGGEAPSQP